MFCRMEALFCAQNLKILQDQNVKIYPKEIYTYNFNQEEYNIYSISLIEYHKNDQEKNRKIDENNDQIELNIQRYKWMYTYLTGDVYKYNDQQIYVFSGIQGIDIYKYEDNELNFQSVKLDKQSNIGIWISDDIQQIICTSDQIVNQKYKVIARSKYCDKKENQEVSNDLNKFLNMCEISMNLQFQTKESFIDSNNINVIVTVLILFNKFKDKRLRYIKKIKQQKNMWKQNLQKAQMIPHQMKYNYIGYILMQNMQLVSFCLKFFLNTISHLQIHTNICNLIRAMLEIDPKNRLDWGQIQFVKSSYLIMMFGIQQQFKTKLITDNNNPHWKISEEFVYNCEAEDLKNSHFKLIIYDDQNQIISQVQVLLYDICTGPVHNDFFLETKEENNSIKIEKSLKHIASGDSFQFKDYKLNLNDKTKSMIRKDKTAARSETEIPYNQNNLHNHMHSHTTFEQLQAHKDMKWEFIDLQNIETPSVSFEIYADEFASSTFQFILWAHKNPEIEQVIQDANDLQKRQQQKDQINHIPNCKKQKSQQNGKEIYVEYQLIGREYISMIRFLSEDVEVKIERDQFIISEVHMQEMKLWYQGQQVGTCNGEFIVTNQPFLKQLVAGVRTEEGIVKAISLYIKKENFTQKTCIPREFKNIVNQKLALEGSVFKLYDISLTFRDRQKINDDIRQILSKIIEYLHIHSQTYQKNLYSNEDELIRAQFILIDLAKHLLEYADQVDQSLRELYYESLILINNREELDLSHMGFQQSHKQELEKYGKQIHNLKEILLDQEKLPLLKKIRICLKYENYLIETLDLVLQKLDQKGITEKERQFVENFCALAFFRIKPFKEKFIECLQASLQDQQNTLIDQWMVNLNNFSHLNTKCLYIGNFFSWEKNYNDYLMKFQKYIEYQQQLQQILTKQNWQKRISKVGVAYFSFLGEWCRYVHKQFDEKDLIPWEIIPGCEILVKSFLIRMQQLETKQFSETLKDTILALLHNENHINIYLRILYNKTNIYDAQNVFFTFDILSACFLKLKVLGKNIPINFDYEFFFRGIKLILEGENFISLSKVIWMLYYCYNLFPIQQKRYLCKIIFTNMFFKLFMHWSRSVRQVFHNFLLYKIYHLHKQHRYVNKLDLLKKQLISLNQKKYLENQEDKTSFTNELIYQDYQRMIAILEEAYKRYKEVKKKNDFLKKNLKKLKFKLYQKRILQKKKQIKQINNQEESSENNNFYDGSNQLLESLNLTIISRKQSANSLQIYTKKDSSFTENYQKEQKNEIIQQNMVDLECNSLQISSISNIDSILSDIKNNLEQEQKEQQKKMKKKNRIQRRNSANFIRNPHISQINENNNIQKIDNQLIQGIKIYRFYNEQDQQKEKLRIPRESLKYLFESWQDFNELRKQYVRWLNDWQINFNKNEDLTEDDIIQKIYSLNTPSLHVTVPHDESDFKNEFSFGCGDDW
ncbi:hypothetical protein IMG5_194620 [Ichthyophthirius multifiliis]|uniref:C2 domain protein n=1 Tax=Ichthyophthirius multifiliis TaxID=5932 RepID=G0R4S5_ICHMU|nr:hypothetical protein IMG5_194620 [Ichthyophthirius multifiliis]EGR27513.1 hypothetical protein IMG5_194620 [Ichthyophthirius multifiliis]|eukprot:XP_004024941.1 hypothetical protein IMG5_194620 [Ichthyophthirius multifiliis]